MIIVQTFIIILYYLWLEKENYACSIQVLYLCYRSSVRRIKKQVWHFGFRDANSQTIFVKALRSVILLKEPSQWFEAERLTPKEKYKRNRFQLQKGLLIRRAPPLFFDFNKGALRHRKTWRQAGVPLRSKQHSNTTAEKNNGTSTTAHHRAKHALE